MNIKKIMFLILTLIISSVFVFGQWWAPTPPPPSSVCICNVSGGTNCSVDGSCPDITYDSELDYTVDTNCSVTDSCDNIVYSGELTSGLATQDECSEITGCVENAVTNSTMNQSTYCENIDGATSNLCTLEDTNTQLSENDVEAFIFDSDNTDNLDMNDYGIFNVLFLNMSGNILPSLTLTYDIGSPTNRWNYLYVGDISADDIDVVNEITASILNVTTTYITNLRVTTINASYIYNPIFPGYMDIRGDPWFLGNADLQIEQDIDVDSNLNVDGNATIDGWITAGDWSNVSITTSQISDYLAMTYEIVKDVDTMKVVKFI